MLVLEHCVTDLSALLKAAPARLHERAVKGVLQQLLRGLAACHAEGGRAGGTGVGGA